MKRSAFAVALVVLSVCGTILAQSPAPLAERMPQGAIFYLGWAGRSDTFDKSKFGQLLGSPVLAEMTQAAHAALQKQAGGDEMEKALLERAWNIAAFAWQHPLAVGMYDINKAGPGANLDAVLIIDAGKDKAALSAEVDKLVKLLGDKLKLTPGDGGLTSFQTPAGECIFGFAENLFVIGFGKSAQAVLDQRPISSRRAFLATQADFAAAMKDVSPGQPQMAYFLDVPKVLALVRKMEAAPKAAGTETPGSAAAPAPTTAPADDQIAKAMKGLGLDKVTAVAGAVTVVDQQMYGKGRIYSKGPHQGLLMLLAGKPLPANALADAPADTLFAAAVSLDPAKLLAEVRRVSGAFDLTLPIKIDAALKAASLQLGVDLEKDLLANLGDQWTIVSAPSLGGLLTGTVASVEVKDAAKVAAILAKLEEVGSRSGDVAFQTVKGPWEIHYMVSKGPASNFFPIAPAWTIAEKKLYIALWPQVLQAALPSDDTLLHRGNGMGNLGTNPDFAAARKKLAGSPAVLTFVNTRSIVRTAYGLPVITWTMLANMAKKQAGVDLRPDMLPDLSAMEDFLRVDMSAISSDENGITFESYGPLPTTGLQIVGPLPVLMGAALYPSANRARELSRRSMSASNLHSIGMGIMIYATQNNSKMPPDMDALLKAKIVPDARVMISPMSGRQPQLDKDGNLIGGSDYVYVGGKIGSTDKVKSPSEFIVAYEPSSFYNNEGANVLFLDGHVAFMPAKAFEEALKKTQDYITKQSEK